MNTLVRTCTCMYARMHAHTRAHLRARDTCVQVMATLRNAPDVATARASALAARRMCAGVRASLETHIRAEEAELWPLFTEHFTTEEQQYLVRACMCVCAPCAQEFDPWKAVSGACLRARVCPLCPEVRPIESSTWSVRAFVRASAPCTLDLGNECMRACLCPDPLSPKIVSAGRFSGWRGRGLRALPSVPALLCSPPRNPLAVQSSANSSFYRETID